MRKAKQCSRLHYKIRGRVTRAELRPSDFPSNGRKEGGEQRGNGGHRHMAQSVGV